VPTSITKTSLLEDLKDKETRDIYVEEHIVTGLPFQIRGLREKHGLTQLELAKRAGMAQERISKLEDPDYEFIPKIPTLLKLAGVFDVPLIVQFGSWSEFFDRETRLSPDMLAPKTFSEEVGELERAASLTYILPVGTYVVTGGSLPVTAVKDFPPLFEIKEPSTLVYTNHPYYSTVTTIEELERQGFITSVPLPKKDTTEVTEPVEATDPAPVTTLSTPMHRNNVIDFPDQKAA
jgi:transcriptional regulator with XRE-family HTH domain